jgi:hypothetical protein
VLLAVEIEQIANEYTYGIDSTAVASGFGFGFGLGARLDKPRMDINPANQVAAANVGVIAVHSQISQEGSSVCKICT